MRRGNFEFPWLPRWARSPLPSVFFIFLNKLLPLGLPAAALLAITYTQIDRYMDFVKFRADSTLRNEYSVHTFDFIVVGGGSAGSVLANRLSKHHTVLLLEAGGTPHPLSLPAIGFFTLIGQPMVDWRYETEPQAFAAQGFTQHRTKWPRGKSLGGSSVINGMIAMRGNPNDFDEWANITGDTSWNYDSVLPFFKKLEKYNGNFPSEKYHGTDGSIVVEAPKYAPGAKQWIKGAAEMGYKVFDLNSRQREGFMATETTCDRGLRSDTYRGYVRPLRNRRNLVVSRYSHVLKVHLDKDRFAYGVTYVRHGVVKFARADKEIILSAGAINTPQILMLSGIGPRDHLHRLGRSCRVNLPVGQNLQDHPMTIFGPIVVNTSTSFLADRDVSASLLLEFAMNGDGAIAAVPVQGTAVLSSSFAKPNWPDIFAFQAGFAIHKNGIPAIALAERVLGLKPNVFSNLFTGVDGRDSVMGAVSVGKPKSRGQIKLRSRDPFEPPLIDPQYLSDPRDVKIMVEGIKKLLNIYEKSATFRKLGAYLPMNPITGCENQVFRSDAYWECYVRTFTLSIYHPCCTCPMGKYQGKRNVTETSVLDSEFRVHKTKKLRVVDASAMPEITNANINLPVIMMGEKASFEIRRYWAEQFLICRAIDVFNDGGANTCFYSRSV